MLNNCKEEDFYGFKLLLGDGYDQKISGGLWGIDVWSFINTLMLTLELKGNININHGFWSKVVLANQILLAIQIVVTVFFMNFKNSYIHQKAQSVVCCLLLLKLSLEGYQLFFLICESHKFYNKLRDTAVLGFFLGIILLIVSSFVYIKKVKKGDFSKKNYCDIDTGKYPYALVFGGIMTVKVIMNHSSETTSTLIFLACLIGIQYIIAASLPKSLIYSYCKFRFKSFIEEMPEIKKEKKSVIIKKSIKAMKANVFKWYRMPIKALKSFAGWRVKEKAPIIALILAYFETAIIIYVALIALFVFGVAFRRVYSYQLLSVPGIVFSMFVSFIVIIVMIVLFKIIKALFNK
ncbi:hypothetical protein [Clostridium hydrogenum]|uniref:hypothetical protein n=1 Tax=Clostridium hydrogenum TaxID=2855764 RepID=UPI001F47C5B5|nr:hypothetical protein [Clostridium hydrogenum]